jgi:hypothetical protein
VACPPQAGFTPPFVFQFSNFVFRMYNQFMPAIQHIEDLQSRFEELKKRIELVRSYL